MLRSLLAVLLAAGTTIAAASSVPPLRMSEPTAVLPGYFQKAHRAQAVVIYGDQASLCSAPDYNRCTPLGHLPLRRTVATTIEGVSRLLVVDSVQSVRVCEVGKSLDCRTVDFNKLADYNIGRLLEGKLLQIEGTDGKYYCAAAGADGVACSRITDLEGKPAIKTSDERKHGTFFRPLDDPKKACRVRNGAINCSGLKVSEGPVMPWLQHALIDIELDGVEVWAERAQREVDYTARYVDYSAPMREGYWRGDPANGAHLSPSALPPTPSNYYQQQCLGFCAQQNTDYADLCAMSAGLALAIFGPAGTVIAPAYFIACEAGRAYNNMRCRQICGV